ncbi:response regulator transcription factor [Mangrovibacterium diazotrophicum]|uniref:DNA-binding response OmpR family regulator n=1 Tax=Mangrovibacterium diazotrophicum TaxID=1261403 RepID=A0A419W9N7_9BACT|nr:response regulator transcription factor [Mangrovibacterium diazotrophicum]RKD92173.1 DNA-binding response OmpR family regulator [Mangrovibacterium diazotrophicum]
MDFIPKILIVDDEQDLREILQFNLSSEGFQIDVAASAEEALTKPLETYHLILLDVMMGGMSGYKMADIVRKEHKLDVPIIFLTAKTSENDLLTGFNVGGDDYIVKPFSIKEVIVRIRAILKRGRATEQPSTTLEHEEMKVDVDRKMVSIDAEAVALTRKEFEILALLLRNKGKFISRQEILDRIWSNDVIVTERNVDVNIARLRKKIGDYGSQIIGRSGYGYCFEK